LEQGTGVDLHFRSAEIIVATSVRTGDSNLPPAGCSAMGSTPSAFSKRKTASKGGFSFGAGYGSRTRQKPLRINAFSSLWLNLWLKTF